MLKKIADMEDGAGPRAERICRELVDKWWSQKKTVEETSVSLAHLNNGRGGREMEREGTRGGLS